MRQKLRLPSQNHRLYAGVLSQSKYCLDQRRGQFFHNRSAGCCGTVAWGCETKVVAIRVQDGQRIRNPPRKVRLKERLGQHPLDVQASQLLWNALAGQRNNDQAQARLLLAQTAGDGSHVRPAAPYPPPPGRSAAQPVPGSPRRPRQPQQPGTRFAPGSLAAAQQNPSLHLRQGSRLIYPQAVLTLSSVDRIHVWRHSTVRRKKSQFRTICSVCIRLSPVL